MKYLKYVILCLLISLIGIFCFAHFHTKKECNILAGGGFHILFDTNGGEKIESMSVCIACAPDTYKDIPTPKREGYIFQGWYYDTRFIRKVESKNSIDIKIIPKKKEGCTVGYQDITLHAKWSK